MQITIAVQNISHGGLRINDDASRNRWDDLIARLAPVEADIVILNEAATFEHDDNKKAQAFGAELGLAVAGVTPSKSDVPTAILYRAERLGELRAWDTKHQYLVNHGFGVASWDLDCLPAPLQLGGIHVTPFSPVQAVIEVQTLVCRAYRSGPYAIVGGDFNFPPLYGKKPDIANMLPFNKMNRLLAPRDPDPQPNTMVAQALYDGGFHDVAAELHMKTGDDQLLAYTGKTDRIDWIAVSQPLRDAIVSYTLLDQPAGASDHEGVACVLDLSKCDTSDPWSYR
jgi:endonuclease/exonuclease/phosphatase family metal-dependent hydrolase